MGRFLQPDTLVPEPGNPQALSRYSYTLNNSVKYIDEDGHNPLLPYILMGVAYYFHHKGYVDRATAGAPTDADALIQMFTSKEIGGEMAAARLDNILAHTRLAPGMYFLGNFGQTGFNPQFQDEYLYKGLWNKDIKSDQVGHFLTGVGLAYKSYNKPEEVGNAAMRLAIGHEKLCDPQGLLVAPGGFLAQYLSASRADMDYFQLAIDADARGLYDLRDSHLRAILGTGPTAWRIGNSLEDLRLTVRGYRFAWLIASGEISTREEAANWLEENIK